MYFARWGVFEKKAVRGRVSLLSSKRESGKGRLIEENVMVIGNQHICKVL